MFSDSYSKELLTLVFERFTTTLMRIIISVINLKWTKTPHPFQRYLTNSNWKEEIKVCVHAWVCVGVCVSCMLRVWTEQGNRWSRERCIDVWLLCRNLWETMWPCSWGEWTSSMPVANSMHSLVRDCHIPQHTHFDPCTVIHRERWGQREGKYPLKYVFLNQIGALTVWLTVLFC